MYKTNKSDLKIFHKTEKDKIKMYFHNTAHRPGPLSARSLLLTIRIDFDFYFFTSWSIGMLW